MKILFINLPYSGHIIPTLGLVKELANRNVEVTYLLTEEWENRILESGAKFASYENSKRLSEQIRNAYEAAIKIGEHFDLLIYEHYFFLGKHVADKLKKPVIRIFTTQAANDELIKMYINSGGTFSIFRNDFICRKWTKKVAKDISMKTDSWLKEITHNPPDLNLVYTIKDFQMFAESFPDEKYKFIGASIYKRDNEKQITFENIKKPIIYISLGTIFNNSKKFYKMCFAAFGNENVSVILSIGNKLKVQDLGKIPSNFYIYQFVPQLDVLKEANVFITHGGMNSVSEALYYGVPMVVIPATTDQPVNAKRIVELHLGKYLDRKKINAKEIKYETLSLLKDNDILKNVLDFKQKMRMVDGNISGADFVINFLK